MNSVPHNSEFERAVLVGLLQDPSLLPRVSGIITHHDMYREKHRQIMEIIESIDIDNLDSLTVEDRISNEGTKEYFHQLVQDSDSLLPSLSNIIFYAETIKNKAKLRAGIDLGRELAAICYQENIDADDALETVETMFSNFLQKRVKENLYESTKEAFKVFIDKLGNRVNDEVGTRTGFKAIDLILHNLEGLIILAARPGIGKTSWAINVARNVAQSKGVVFFSLEQTQDQVFERMLAAEAEVSLEDIRTGVFVADPKAVERIEIANEKLLDVLSRVHVDERSSIPTSHIASVARQKQFEWGEIGLIIVDYLHIVRLNDKNLVDALGDATKELRALGKELRCPVLLLSQLSRQPEMQLSMGGDGDNKKVRRRPELTDLRSSGEIEQSADVVMFLYRDSYYDQTGYVPDEDEIEVIIKKNRNGRTGITSLVWVPKFIKFKDIH